MTTRKMYQHKTGRGDKAEAFTFGLDACQGDLAWVSPQAVTPLFVTLPDGYHVCAMFDGVTRDGYPRRVGLGVARSGDAAFAPVSVAAAMESGLVSAAPAPWYGK